MYQKGHCSREGFVFQVKFSSYSLFETMHDNGEFRCTHFRQFVLFSVHSKYFLCDERQRALWYKSKTIVETL